MTTVGVGGLCDAVFSQGDKGTSWYIIWKGSVNVITHGKVIWSKRACVYCHVVMELDSRRGVCTQGLVTTLHEGEDFGQLALLNDAPRAATIILREDNCHFLRVDKQDFIRILKVWSHLRPFCAQRKEQSGRHTLFFVHFRMLRRIQCDCKNMGKLCWCWRRAPTGLNKQELETTASEGGTHL